MTTAEDDASAAPPATPGQLIRELMAVQGQRAQCYNDMERAFKTYLVELREQEYLQTVNDCTQKFVTFSAEVNKIEESLKQTDRKELAVGIRGVQQSEKVKLQMAKAAKERDGGDSPALTDDTCEPVQHSHQGNGCCACGPPPPEPTEAELNAAISEATQNLEAAISEINDLLEELRFEQEDED